MTGPEKKKLTSGIDIPALVKRGAELLRSAGVHEFILIGGCAIRAYGLERNTKDVDFATREESLSAVLAAFNGKSQALPIGGYSLTLPEGTIDLIDRRRDIKELYEDAIQASLSMKLTVSAQDVEVPVVTLEHLISMKLAAGRPQDEADIAFLLKLPTLDYPKTRQIAKHYLGVFAATYLDRLMRLAGRPELTKEFEYESSDS